MEDCCNHAFQIASCTILVWHLNFKAHDVEPQVINLTQWCHSLKPSISCSGLQRFSHLLKKILRPRTRNRFVENRTKHISFFKYRF
eukprot:1570286-Amphidinium_carterae.1